MFQIWYESRQKEWLCSQRTKFAFLRFNGPNLIRIKQTEFKATKSWCYRFMKRNDFVIRRQTKIEQKAARGSRKQNFQFPKNYDKSKQEALSSTLKPRKYGWDTMSLTWTLSSKGEKKTFFWKLQARFTVVLACMADGTKLRPMIIFKLKAMSMLMLKDGWMDGWRGNQAMDSKCLE